MLAFAIVLVISTAANAGFLRIVPNILIASLDGKPGKAQITGTIENEGDESALNVVLETARTGKLLIDAGTLGAGEKKEVTIEVTEADLGVEKEGYYNIPLRVLYKDSNHASFSAAFINSYTKKGESGALGRTSPISLALDEVVIKAGGVDIAKSGSFRLSLVNTSSSPAEINIEFIGTREVEIKTENSKIHLSPQEEKSVDVSVKNISALPGSSYASYALVSGVVEGQSFSDYIGFVVNIRAAAEIPIITWLLVALALVFAGVGYSYWRKDSSTNNQAQ